MDSLSDLLQALPEEEELTSDAVFPSPLEIATMPLESVISTLNAMVQAAASHDLQRLARLAAHCCVRVATLVQRPGAGHVVARAGGLQVVVSALQAFTHSSELTAAAGMEAIALIGLEEEELRAMALDAGSLVAVVAAMRTQPQSELVVTRGMMALSTLVGSDVGVLTQARALGASDMWLQLCAAAVPPPPAMQE